MKIKNVLFLIFLAIPGAGCDIASRDFEMTVERVEVLKGFILKGIAISGAIKSGCIANDDVFVVKRDGEKVLETTARILDVSKKSGTEPFNGKAFKGDFVHLYIPDAKEEDVRVGDIVSSGQTSCDIQSAGLAPVEIKQADVNPIQVQPVEVQPIEVQPIEVQPVEVQPVEVHPVEVQPVEVKPVEVKPDDQHYND